MSTPNLPSLSSKKTDCLSSLEIIKLPNGIECQDRELRWSTNDSEHPRNWPLWRKCFDTTVILSLEFFTTVISTAGSAAAEEGRNEYNLSPIYSIFAFTSIYLYAQAIGGLIFPPISESIGRKSLYIGSMFFFSGMCIITGTVPNIAGVLFGRLLMGLVSAIPSIIVVGSIEDMYGPQMRVWMIFAWGLFANIGLVLGPIYSAYVTQNFGWRWVFWIAAIITFCQAILTVFIKESRPSQILNRRLLRLNKATEHTTEEPYRIFDPDHSPTLSDFVTTSLTRPTRLLFTEPIVFLVSLMTAIAFGQIYLLTEALPFVYAQAPFNFNAKYGSLSFVPILIGFILDIIPRICDHRLLKRIKLSGHVIKPEHKLRGFLVGGPALAIGLWWFAWTIPPAVNVPWILSMIPLILVGFATNEFDCTLAGYLTDSYTIYSASAYASLGFLRAIVSGTLPLFTVKMYKHLGANNATTILACIATVFCIVPILFLKYGERLREKSVFAKYSREAEKKMECVPENLLVVRQDISVRSSTATLVEDKRKDYVEVVVVELAERGEARRSA